MTDLQKHEQKLLSDALNNSGAMLYLLHELEQVAAQHGYLLCPTCSTLYEPCAVVTLQWTDRGVAHILPLVCVFVESWRSVWQGYLQGRLCDGTKHMPVCGVFCRKCATLDDREFLTWLLRRYPGLSRKPLMESVLRLLGIDLEAEIAMWRLSQ